MPNSRFSKYPFDDSSIRIQTTIMLWEQRSTWCQVQVFHFCFFRNLSVSCVLDPCSLILFLFLKNWNWNLFVYIDTNPLYLFFDFYVMTTLYLSRYNSSRLNFWYSLVICTHCTNLIWLTFASFSFVPIATASVQLLHVVDVDVIWLLHWRIERQKQYPHNTCNLWY